ncbi:MAG: DNA polymerase Y family protein [Caulobacteraceae bacterium]
MERILCVWSPAWAIANWRRRHPSAASGEAFALIAAERGVRRLTAVDEGAAGLGLFVGQKATDAAALVPRLVTAEADPVADRAALDALSDWCARFSPAVAPGPPDGLFLDITGVAYLWGGEAAMAADLAARLAANGIPVRVAVAGTVGAAWALAHFGAGTTIAAPGEEMARLAPLPVAALRLEEETAAQFARLGLTTVERLAGTPRDQLTRRFGPDVVRRLDQALGRASEALVFRRTPNPWFARLAFAEPISTPDDLARATADIAAVLCARLEAEAQGARRFELTFHRLDGVAQRLSIGLSLAGREADRIARLFAPHLESVDPGFGIEVVTLAAEAVERLSPRQPSLDAAAQAAAEEAIAPLIDRLAGRLGSDAVWRAEPYPSHAPERAVARGPPLSVSSGAKWDLNRPRPLRLFSRPEPIEAIAPVPDDPPVFFRWRGVAHRVRLAEGPERLAREWWRLTFDQAADPVLVRDYYRVEDEAGGRFWLFRAGLHTGEAPAKWWLHGLFG